MAAPVKPEAAPSGAPGTKVPSAEELASQKTPQTKDQPLQRTEPENVQPAPPVKPELTQEQRIIAAQEATLRDQHRQLTELTQRQRSLDERVTRTEKGPEPTEADLNENFWKNPTGVLGGLIERELAKTVAPINERLNKISQSGQLTEYDRAKLEIKKQYEDIWDQIEPHIDEWARGATAAGTEVNEQLLNLAALTASGAYYRGQLPGMTERPTAAPAAPPAREPAPPGDRTVATPPHLRPSAPPVPGQDRPAAKEVRALTENEARLARERKQTPEEYLAWLEVPPEQVVHSQVGRKAKP